MTRSRLQLIVRWSLGLLLLAAAGLKAHELLNDPLFEDSFFSSPRLQIVTIEAEIVLGLWLLSCWFVRAAWATAVIFFAVLASASLYLALDGQPSCGCFGQVTVSPWATFAFDAIIVTALLAWHLPQSFQLDAPGRMRGVLPTALGTTVILALSGVL